MNRILQTLAAIGLASAITIGLPAFGQTADATLTVQGSGSAAAVPDLVEIEVGVVTEAQTAAAALAANNTSMRQLHTTLQGFNIAERDQQTSAFSVFPSYSRQGPQAGVVGYRVENRLHLRLREGSRLGEVLDAVVTDGANTVHSIQFGLADPQAVRDRARQAAVADAQRSAELYAAAAGIRLGRVLALSEHSGDAMEPRPMARMAMAAEAVPVAAGETTVNVRITMAYEIVAP